MEIHLTRPVGRTSPTRKPATRTRIPHRRIPAKRRSSIFKITVSILISILALFVWAFVARRVAPKSNTNRQSFDAIIVLGTPADSDGNPTPELLDRITEGVHEYERGIAPRLIVTGAAAHNRFVEAEVMARVAESQGVPAAVVFEEPRALDTIQNACYSARILQSHGWHSAEIVSSAAHLPRAALIFSHLTESEAGSFAWRVHAVPINLTPDYYSSAADLVEIVKTARYLLWSRWVERCTP
jgi:uncharacterized SAM-binding protein YcdF (DUF218 family)